MYSKLLACKNKLIIKQNNIDVSEKNSLLDLTRKKF
jgi:hypothetical protein